MQVCESDASGNTRSASTPSVSSITGLTRNDSVVQPEGELSGRRPREVRLKREVTQQWLLEAVGMSGAYISNLERGFKVPSLTTITRLALFSTVK